MKTHTDGKRVKNDIMWTGIVILYKQLFNILNFEQIIIINIGKYNFIISTNNYF